MHPKRDFITKTKSGSFQVKSHEGKVLGTHKTRAEALQQLRAVEYHKAHDAHARDAHASMGKLELPGAGEESYLGRDIGVLSPDGFGAAESNVLDPLQPHELPERRGNPHHATDPMREPSGPNEHNGHDLEFRYLKVEEPKGGPAVDASGAPGGNQPSPDVWPAVENNATEREEERAGLHRPGAPDPLGDSTDCEDVLDPMPRKNQPGSIKPKEEYRAPFAPGGNGDPSPNPSKKQTIGSTLSTSIAGHEMELAGPANAKQPDEDLTSSLTALDEGDPNQYEMLSTARLAPDLNEANEPNYGEYVSPASTSQPGQGAGWRDPSGDDDWLEAVGAINGPAKAAPGVGGSEL
jgi:hypothetical protein